MITKSQTKRKQDIKTKLMAAIAMLLVSSIMMVSSTYAWFTLSTAPEVTGINTAVGANGNLEIALMPKTGATSDITSAVGDSVKAIQEKNVTWGNLVDLSNNDVYGLDKINLYPAALNASADRATFGSIMLKTPTYGSDGRVAELVANTSTGFYDAAKNSFTPNENMGVRGIGTASGMSERQLAYRNARSAANTASAAAKSTASNSLSNNGSALANIAIKKGTATETTKYTLEDLQAMQRIVDDLLGTANKTGALQYVDQAYMQYILAYAASAQGGEDTVYRAVQALVEADGATANSVLTAAGTNVPGVSDAVEKLEATKTDVTDANDLLATLMAGATEASEFTWEQIGPILTLLANPDTMKINGINANVVKDNIDALVNAVLSGEGINVTMATDGGVYADIADHCGNYSSQVVIDEITYGGLGVKKVKARMSTDSSISAYLTAINSAVETAGAPASNVTAGETPITDMFGYVIDLAFRTNAAESKLLLQNEAVDRIYSDNANDGTMGHGSNMTFSFVSDELVGVGADNNPDYSRITNLISAIRLVFFTPGEDNNTVVKYGALVCDQTAPVNGEWVAKIVLTDIDGNEATKDSDGNYEIMNLNQNTAMQLSVLVYLDGDLVGNDDVAVSAAMSMSGKLNLQFASSANLVPMDYSQLHTPASGSGNTNNNGGTGEGTGNTDTPAEPTT